MFRGNLSGELDSAGVCYNSSDQLWDLTTNGSAYVWNQRLHFCDSVCWIPAQTYLSLLYEGLIRWNTEKYLWRANILYILYNSTLHHVELFWYI